MLCDLTLSFVLKKKKRHIDKCTSEEFICVLKNVPVIAHLCLIKKKKENDILLHAV